MAGDQLGGLLARMPAVSKRQQMFMGAELARKRAGAKTRTGMSEAQLRDFAKTKRKGLPASAGGPRRAREAKHA